MKKRPSIRRIALLLGMAYFAAVVLVGCVQRRLLYFPADPSAGELRAQVDANHLKPWTNAAGLRIGWRRDGSGPAPRPPVLVVHGNGGCAADRAYIIDPLQNGFPCDVHVLEYPGFAGRPGSPSQESLLAAADEAAGLLAARGPVFVVGESLGTGVACHLAATRPKDVAGVVLLAPYNHLGAVAGYHYPWLPVRLLLLDKFPSDEWLPRYDGPVAVVLGLADGVVPARFGRALHDGYPGPKRLWELPGAGHGGAAVRPPEWWSEAFGFLASTPRRVP